MIGRRDFFFIVRVLLLSIYILTPRFSPSSFVSLSYFILAVPMSECLGIKMLMHDFLISYSHTEWLYIYMYIYIYIKLTETIRGHA